MKKLVKLRWKVRLEKMRCSWCNGENKKYVDYHDNEWGVLNTSDDYLFEMLILEGFQAGLSWITILKKRENFRKAFDNFDIQKVANYNNEKIEGNYLYINGIQFPYTRDSSQDVTIQE